MAGRDYEPSNAERAVHAALVLFAVHSQSATGPRHVAGRRLGLTIGELAGDNRDDGPTAGRYHAFATETTWNQRLHHLRGLVAQLRTNGIPLDYGSLAADLYRQQRPGGLEKVRLRWGRDFHSFKTRRTRRTDMRLYIDLHVIQSVPPSNINRDDTGSPKSAFYGGQRRVRVSSPAWKRAIRHGYGEPSTKVTSASGPSALWSCSVNGSRNCDPI